jgi:hypothetical protein
MCASAVGQPPSWWSEVGCPASKNSYRPKSTEENLRAATESKNRAPDEELIDKLNTTTTHEKGRPVRDDQQVRYVKLLHVAL